MTPEYMVLDSHGFPMFMTYDEKEADAKADKVMGTVVVAYEVSTRDLMNDIEED